MGTASFPYEPTTPSAQFTICTQFFKFLRDLPFILCGMIVTCLLWRAFFMWRDILSATRASKRREAALYHFGMLFVDIIDLPFAVAALIITVTIWRAFHFWPLVVESTLTRNQRRKLITTQFGWWLLGISSITILTCKIFPLPLLP